MYILFIIVLIFLIFEENTPHKIMYFSVFATQISVSLIHQLIFYCFNDTKGESTVNKTFYFQIFKIVSKAKIGEKYLYFHLK